MCLFLLLRILEAVLKAIASFRSVLSALGRATCAGALFGISRKVEIASYIIVFHLLPKHLERMQRTHAPRSPESQRVPCVAGTLLVTLKGGVSSASSGSSSRPAASIPEGAYHATHADANMNQIRKYKPHPIRFMIHGYPPVAFPTGRGLAHASLFCTGFHCARAFSAA